MITLSLRLLNAISHVLLDICSTYYVHELVVMISKSSRRRGLRLNFNIINYNTESFEGFFSSEGMLMQNLFPQRSEPELCLLIQNFPARLQKIFLKIYSSLRKVWKWQFFIGKLFQFFRL